jgi:hypothetical protein
MTTTNKTGRRAHVSFKLPGPTPLLITFAQGVVNAMTNNPSFPTPLPALALVQTSINQLQTAETAAQGRAKGTATVRNDRRTALVAQLELLGAYVQSIADANVENGAAIIQSAALAVRKIPLRPPRAFAVKLGPVSGSVKLSVPAAARRAAYDWQYSTDGGKTWLDIPSTLQAKTTMTGLAVATTPQFRYRAVLKAGEGDWSQAISILVK